MADCKNCHYGAEGGGGNFGMVSVVCCYYGSLECDPAGDCQNFEEAQVLCTGHLGGSEVKKYICQTCGLPVTQNGEGVA